MPPLTAKGLFLAGLFVVLLKGSFKLSTKYRNKLTGGKKKKAPTDYRPLWPMGATSREQVGHFLSTDALPSWQFTT
jgi:hypothetical protein